jgi:hypothetical protein
VAIFANQEEIPMFSVRVILWTVAMAYTGFILTNQGLRTFNSLSITEAFLGALTGFLLAIMFTLRGRRRQRPAFLGHSLAQIFPDWGTSHENRDSGPKLKR